MKTIRELGNKTTVITFGRGEGPVPPRYLAEEKVYEFKVLSGSELVIEAMNDGSPIDIDGAWFFTKSAAIPMNSIGEPCTFYLEATRAPGRAPVTNSKK